MPCPQDVALADRLSTDQEYGENRPILLRINSLDPCIPPHHSFCFQYNYNQAEQLFPNFLIYFVHEASQPVQRRSAGSNIRNSTIVQIICLA